MTTAFDWLHAALRTLVTQELESPMPRGRETLEYRSRPDFMDASFVEKKKHIVFVSYYPNVTAIKTSIALRESGRYYTTLICCCAREDAAVTDFFDQCFEILDYTELLAVLSTARPFAVHAHIQPWIIGIVAVEAGKRSGTPTLIHINDSNLFVEKDPESQLCLLERETLRNCHAFTHKMPPEAIDAMRATWKLAMPDALIHAFPVTAFCVPPKRPDSLRIVFAGGVIPYRIAIARGHENHVLDPLIQKTESDSFDLSIVVNANARNMYWEEQDHYFDLERAFPRFRFLPGYPLHSMPAMIVGHTCGIHYENRPESSYNPKHFEYNMATKIFSYLEAGLPVMVSNSAPYIVRFVEEHGIGFGYSFSRFTEGINRLKTFDMQAWEKARETFCREFSMASNLPALDRVYA